MRRRITGNFYTYRSVPANRQTGRSSATFVISRGKQVEGTANLAISAFASAMRSSNASRPMDMLRPETLRPGIAAAGRQCSGRHTGHRSPIAESHAPCECLAALPQCCLY